MAIRYYDEALHDKLKNWLPKELHANVLKPDDTARLFALSDDEKEDKEIELPIIALSRDSNFELLETTKSPLSFNGKKLGNNIAGTKTINLNAIPISIYYQIDIYTKHYEEGDTILRELIFKFLNNPRLKVTLPYNGVNLEHYAYTRLSPTVTDNSDIPERLFPGEFTRWTIQLEIKDAYLFSIPIKDNWHIEEESSTEIIEPVLSELDLGDLDGDYEVEINNVSAKLND